MQSNRNQKTKEATQAQESIQVTWRSCNWNQFAASNCPPFCKLASNVRSRLRFRGRKQEQKRPPMDWAEYCACLFMGERNYSFQQHMLMQSRGNGFANRSKVSHSYSTLSKECEQICGITQCRCSNKQFAQGARLNGNKVLESCKSMDRESTFWVGGSNILVATGHLWQFCGSSALGSHSSCWSTV